jgi:hypothetical protein
MRRIGDILTEQMLHVEYSKDSVWEYYFIKTIIKMVQLKKNTIMMANFEHNEQV